MSALKAFVYKLMSWMNTHKADASAHHTKYTNADAVDAMGVKGDANPLHHDRAVEHTDHQAAQAESAEFKDVNIPTGEAYKQNDKILLRALNYNITVGINAGLSISSGNYNAFIGWQSGYLNSTGNSNAFIGSYAGSKNISGLSNTCIGYYSGRNLLKSYNMFIGPFSGYECVNGEYNTFIGAFAGRNTLGSNNTFIGAYTGYNETGSDKLYINNSDAVIPLIWGDFTNSKVGIRMKPAVSKFGVAGIVEYADNAAAVTAGLSVGEFYRTGDLLKIVHA